MLLSWLVGSCSRSQSTSVCNGPGSNSATYTSKAGAVLPLVLSLIGWIELVLGVRFVELARRFDTGSGWMKAWIGAVVVLLSGGLSH